MSHYLGQRQGAYHADGYCILSSLIAASSQVTQQQQQQQQQRVEKARDFKFFTKVNPHKKCQFCE
jgi:hypothetical protein